MTSLAKVIGTAALAAMLVAPQAMARDGRGGGPGFSGGGFHGGGKIGGMGGGFNRGGGNFGGGNFARAPRFDGGSVSRGPRLGNQAFDRGPRNSFDGFKGPGRKHSGNWGGNWDGPRHHHRHNRGFGFYTYGAPYYYDDYYDYGYSSFDDDGACSVYWRRWQATGSPRWRARYYDCIS